MILYFKILLFLLPFSFLYSQDCKSKIIIETDLKAVNILINDSLVSVDNQFQAELKNGKYKIVIMENSDRYDSKLFVDTIELKNCEEKRLSFFSQDKFYLDSSPQDAYVYSGDSLIGNTPLFIPQSLAELKLIKPEYAEKIVYRQKLSSNNLVILEYAGKKKDESFFNSAAFKILTGTAIILGAASAYYKIKADNSFDDYQFSGNKKKLDETNKYDVVSGVTFTALQINFGYILYRFLTE